VSNYVIGIDPAGARGGYTAMIDRSLSRGWLRSADEEHMPEFVSAFCQAVEQSKGLHYALGDVVDDPFREQPAFVNAWLFGPHGEFTTYAKPAVLKEQYDFNCRHFDVGKPALWTSTNRYLAGINFLVTLLSAPHLYPHQKLAIRAMGGRDQGALSFMRFLTYEDYAAWAEVAERDNTDPRSL
jgi:hypothetical protein